LRGSTTSVGRAVGRVGTSGRHHELGPVALALVKRQVPDDATLTVAGIPAAIDPADDSDVPVSPARAAAAARSGLLRLPRAYPHAAAFIEALARLVDPPEAERGQGPLLGIWAAGHIFRRISRDVLMRVVAWVLLASGGSLIVRALA